MIMASAKRIGSGWHSQSVRHSNAKRLGHAGGKYANRFLIEHRGKNADGSYNFHYTTITKAEKVDFLMKSGLHTRSQLYSLEDRTLNDLFQAGLEATGMKYRKEFKDSDGDGVPDHLDCKPNDPKKQGTNDQVVEAWAKYSQRDSSGSLESKGNTIYSYNTPIAIKLADGTILINKQKYSTTTSIHQNKIRKATQGKNVKEVTEEELETTIRNEGSKPKPVRDFQAEDKILPNQIIDISTIKERHEKAGYHFFEKSAKRFFDSKIGKNAYVDKKGDNAYFITSEQFHHYGEGRSDPRKYSVRKANLRTGEVDTVGEFQSYPDSKTATRKAQQLAKE